MSRSIKKSASAVAIALSACALLIGSAGCSATGSSTAGSSISAATGSEPVAGRPTPVENTTKKPIRIAVVDFPSQVAEVFKASEAGASRAGQVLAAYNATVDYLPVTTVSADGVNQVVRTAMTEGYDAIAVTLLGAANCAPMKEAVDKGIKVAAIMSSADCVQSTGALFYHGEDSLPAWTAIGKQMAEVTGTAPCTAGLITGFFSAPQHEARREGLLAGIAGTHLTAVGKGVEAGVDTAKYQAAARDYVTANPDLCAILITTGDNGAAASTLTTEQAAKIKVISSDLTSGTRKQIEAGKQYAAVEQDPFGSTYDSSIWLYNAVVTGKGPEGGFNQPVKNMVVTKDNLQEALRIQTEGA